MYKNSLHFKDLQSMDHSSNTENNLSVPLQTLGQILRTLGITSTEHTFTKGTWFSSDMPVSFLSVAHAINVVHTNLVLINTQLSIS